MIGRYIVRKKNDGEYNTELNIGIFEICKLKILVVIHLMFYLITSVKFLLLMAVVLTIVE